LKTVNIKTTVFTQASIKDFPGIFLTIVRAIIAATVFSDCPYTQAQMEDAAAKMLSCTTNAVRAGETERNLRDQQRVICESILKRLSTFILEKASEKSTIMEQIAIVQLAKFTVARLNPQPAGIIIAPTPKANYSGTAGTINLKWKAPKRVLFWNIQHVAGNDSGPAADWKIWDSCHGNEYSATGLSTGYHSFRLIGVTARGKSDPSQAASQYAQ